MNNQKNINFVLVGAKATGKTVYLASLYLNTKMVTSQDTKTTQYLKQMSDTLLEGKFPNATSGNLYDLIFNYKDENFNCTIQMDDVDGHFIETLSEEEEHTQQERNKFLDKLKSSEGVFFFFPFETNFHEKSIKEFNYQIDTVITTLKSIYSDRNNIPIPASILVSKWDKSSDYQAENEEEKAKEYIKNNQFLKLAQEKIEEHFSHIKVIPLSATGKDIHQLEPYALERPIQHSLENVYSIWVKRVEELKNNDEELLLFLSTIYQDIQFYENGKYIELYNETEKALSEKILHTLKNVQNHKEYLAFQEKNSKVIDVFSKESRQKIKKLENNFKKKYLKKASIALAVSASIVAFAVNHHQSSEQILGEDALFSSINIAYDNHNYDKALKSINTYNTAYNEMNIEHTKNIVSIENTIQKRIALSDAKKIINEVTFNNLKEIETLLAQFSKLGVNQPKIEKQLIEKKNKLLRDNAFSLFKNNLKESSIQDAIKQIKENWKNFYTEEHKETTRAIINNKLNEMVNELLNTTSSVYDIDEYQHLVNTLDEISTILEETQIDKIDYHPTLTKSNKIEITNKKTTLYNYKNLIENGITHLHVSFGAYYPENEPLGFNCTNEKEILLFIGKYKYNYEKRASCKQLTIKWNRTSHIFKSDVLYPVKVTEVDLIDNNHYNKGSLKFTKNELIKIYNGESLKKDIGSGYFISFKRD